MPAELSWYVPGHIAYIRITGQFTLGDLDAGVSVLLEYLGAAHQKQVHILHDVRAMSQTPLDLAPASDTTTQRLVMQPVFQHPHLGWWVMVGMDSPLLELLVVAIERPFAVQRHAVETLAAAHAFLLECDPDLADLLPPLPDEADES